MNIPMISRFDDFCVHQTPDYVAVPVTTDRNFYDRYFFIGYSTDASVIFGFGYGRYPNRHVNDAHFSIVVDGVQYSLHASDRLASAGVRADPSASRVGPLSVEVLEPMRVLRCSGGSNSTGIAFELTFRAVSGAIDEGRLQVPREGLLYIDQTRFMQYGSWEGWVEIDGRRIPVDPQVTYGLRDKSWGVREMAEQTVAPEKTTMFWMNVVMLLQPDAAIRSYSVIRTVDRPDGSSHERTGYFAPIYDDPASAPVGERDLREIRSWNFDLDFRPGTRIVASGRYRVDWPDGTSTDLEGVALGTFWYQGIGYYHPVWSHGLDHGGLRVEREEWSVADIDLSRPDRQFVASVMAFRANGKTIGFGHTEHHFLGTYQPYGWTDRYAGLP